MRRRDEKFPDNGFEAWGGYMQAKIAKLEEQFISRSGNGENVGSNIFHGVSIFVNGYTNPSADDLKTLMARHGGVYHTYKRSDDFIIASNLPDVKVKRMTLAKVVRPEWITESIASNCLLDYKDFLLYNHFRTQPKIQFNKIVKTDQSVSKPEHLQNSEDVPKTEFISQTKISESEIKFQEIQAQVSKTAESMPSTTTHIHNKKKTKSSTKTAADPNFISEFYSNSRLHHISQLGACFKQHINNLRDSSDFTFPARKELKDLIFNDKTINLSHNQFDGGKTIMHIDMDCFFVSVGLRSRPELRGIPIAVTHSKGGQPQGKRAGVDRNAEFNLYRQKQAIKMYKSAGLPKYGTLTDTFETRVDNIAEEDDKYGSMSEIASCSYEARAKGVKNGMFMGAALRLCPDIKSIPYDFEGYKEVAFCLYNTVAKYTLDIEAVSCDEMYVDCTEVLKSLNVTAQDFATQLRQEIRTKTGCPCSTGFGGNRLQARLATKHAKPDGQFFLFAELVHDFMFDIKLTDLPGVGRTTSHKLETLGHQTCGSLQNVTLETLQQSFGNKNGQQLYEQCRGRDPNPLSFHAVRKSVSAEVNYGIRFESNDQCFDFLKQLSAEVHCRLVQSKVLGKCITLKLMVRADNAPVETAKFMGHGVCNIINKSINLANSTNEADIIAREVIGICKKQKIDPKEMRGVGIQITKLEPITGKQTQGAINRFLAPTKTTTATICSSSAHLNEEQKLTKSEHPVPSYIKNDKSPTITDVKLSPIKNKAPAMATSRSPSIRKRGRPTKILSLSKATQLSTSRQLISKFLQGNSSTGLVKEETPAHAETKKEKKETPEEESKEPQKPGLLGLPWQKVRELLRAWLDSGQTPLPCDVNLITMYMRQMVLNKDIDKVNILLNFLRRRTREIGSEQWANVYDLTEEKVQTAMIAVYGKNLYICN